MTARPPPACAWAWIALLGVLFSLGVLLIMPVVRPDLDLLRYPPSFYTTGPWARVQSAAFVTTGLASIAMAAALWQWRGPSRWLHFCGAALIVGGVSSISLVWFPMQNPGAQTIIGDMHQTAGTIGGVAQLVAALAFVLLTRGEPRLASLSLPAMIAFGAALAGAVVSQIALWWPRLDIPIGVTMRLVLAPLLLLWGLVAWRLRQNCAAPANR